MHAAGPGDEPASLTGALLLALFERKDPAVEAVIEAADDPDHEGEYGRLGHPHQEMPQLDLILENGEEHRQ